MRFPLLIALSLVFAPTSPYAALVAHHDEERFTTTRTSSIVLPLPSEEDAFFFVVFGDRTSGPPEGIKVLAQAVGEVNLLGPDLVMTVGDLVQGYNERPQWLEQMREYKSTMDELECPWFPVVGNHDIYWRGQGQAPKGQHEADYEENFGPLWYAFRHKKSWFIALYSDEGDPLTGKKAFDDPACQKMSPEQFAWLEATLGKAKGADNVFVFLHHPRWLRGGYGDDWDRVHELLVRAHNVRAVFAGHIHHMRYDGKKDGIEYFALATVGAVQDGFAARAGYLHEYHIVTVRKTGLAVATFPVGSALDTRAITGAVSDEVRALAQSLVPRWKGSAGFAADQSVEADLALELKNPTPCPIEVTAAPESEDSRWGFTPEHQHMMIPPGETRTLRLALTRPPRAFDEWFRMPEIAVNVDYLGESWRVPLPERRWTMPLDAASLPLPTKPAEDRVLELDGKGDALLVEDAKIGLPDGPFTLEAWFRARSFDKRTGLVCKTESSDYGLFVSAGRPTFSVHLSGEYVTAEKREMTIGTDAWHHLAGVFDGSQVRLYFDGALIDTAKGSRKRTTNKLPLVIGGDVDKDGRAASTFAGEIDEVRLSKVARYAGARFEPARRLGGDADTLLYLPMDGALGPWVPDHSGHGAHATRTGRPQLVTAR